MIGALLAVALCASSSERVLTVFAAASLRDAVTQIARDFERARPGVDVRLSFAGSQQLSAQLRHGAPADVFLSAAPENLDSAPIDRATRAVIATNRLVVVTPARLPDVRAFSDLPKARRIVLADKAVPAGRYAASSLSKARAKFGDAWLARIESRIVSREQDVRSVLAKVALGEADAGIVYGSDAHSAGSKVRRIEIPADLNVLAKYPGAVVSASKNKALARQFLAFLTSRAGRAILRSHGLGVPGGKGT